MQGSQIEVVNVTDMIKILSALDPFIDVWLNKIDRETNNFSERTIAHNVSFNDYLFYTFLHLWGLAIADPFKCDRTHNSHIVFVN